MRGRKAAFVPEYLVDYNATQAAIRAGYSKKTAYSQGSRLLKDPEVAAAIKELREQRHKERTADEYEVIEFLTSVMRGEKIETVPIFISKGEQDFKDGKPSARDKLKAAELLGRHYGVFEKDETAEKVTVEIKLPDEVKEYGG